MNKIKTRKTNWLFLISSLVILGAALAFSYGQPSTVDAETYKPAVYSTAYALLPPVIAIGLALITKEVYSSLFVGIVMGAGLYANGNVELLLNTLLFNKMAVWLPSCPIPGMQAF